MLSWTWVQKLVTNGHLSNRAQTHMDKLEQYDCADWEMSTPPSVDLVMWLPFCRKRYPGNLGLTVLDASQPIRDHLQSFDLTAQIVTFSSSQSGRILHGHVCRQSQGCDGWFSVYCGPAMTVCSSRTLGRMIWVVLLPDLPYWWRKAQYVAQAEFGSGIWWSY